MAEEIKEGKNEIVADIEASLEQFTSGTQPGYRMTIHPNGVVEIVTGGFMQYPVYGNPHYSCCCRCG